jgi:amino-acid N-acetyltransferase
MRIKIRQAQVKDVPAMAAIVNDYAEQGLMLHRSHAELYESIRDFHVAVAPDDRIVGLCALRIMWSNLAEIYALAVVSESRGQGVGKRLVLTMVDQGEELGIKRLFALTYEQKFFERCGFHVVDRHQTLPLKVWGECVRCPKNHACDEIAVVRELDVPDLGATQDLPAHPPRYEVPVLSDLTISIDRSAGRK